MNLTDAQSRRVWKEATYSRLAGTWAAIVCFAFLAIVEEVQILGPSSLSAFETPFQVVIFMGCKDAVCWR